MKVASCDFLAFAENGGESAVGSQMVRARVHLMENVGEGDRVFLSFTSEACMVFPAGAEEFSVA